MRVTLYYPGKKDVSLTTVEVECDSAFVRDGALIIVSSGLDSNSKTERGIPLSRLQEWKITRPAEVGEPQTGIPAYLRLAGARTTPLFPVAPTNMVEAHAAGWHVGERKPGCPECEPVRPVPPYRQVVSPGMLDSTGPDHPVEPGDPFDEVLLVLDGWIEGAKSNHEAMGHRGESTGEECWNTFHPEDIRRMVEDARTSHKPGQ